MGFLSRDFFHGLRLRSGKLQKDLFQAPGPDDYKPGTLGAGMTDELRSALTQMASPPMVRVTHPHMTAEEAVEQAMQELNKNQESSI